MSGSTNSNKQIGLSRAQKRTNERTIKNWPKLAIVEPKIWIVFQKYGMLMTSQIAFR